MRGRPTARGMLLRLVPLVLVVGLLVVLNLSGGGGHGSASLVGPEQMVFQWSRSSCEPIDVPDAPARAFRDSKGNVELIAASYVNRRFIGPDLDHLAHPCDIVMPSQYDPNPAGFDDRSLGCIAEIPQGGLAWFMEGDDDSVMRATDAACADALRPLGGRAPLGMIAFDCIARREVLGDAGIRREVDLVAAQAAGAPVAGFYTYGEIARTHGVAGFHNQTLVVLAVS